MTHEEELKALQKTVLEFEEVATRVEERFTTAYDPTVESKRVNVSMGWWLVIKRLGLAIWISDTKPEITSGDLLSISIKKVP
jgi:hypothetical protein